MVLNNLLSTGTSTATDKDGKPLTLEEQQARTNLVASLVAAIASTAGADASAATTAAIIETENNGEILPNADCSSAPNSPCSDHRFRDGLAAAGAAAGAIIGGIGGGTAGGTGGAFAGAGCGPGFVVCSPTAAAAAAAAGATLGAAGGAVAGGAAGYGLGDLIDKGLVVLNEINAANESPTARAAREGVKGEQAVGLFGPKVGIRIPGSSNLRFPDNLTLETLTEVKNVGRQGLTKQLRDYITFSKSNNLDFELYVRPSTRLTEPLEAAIRSKQITLKYIPGAQ